MATGDAFDIKSAISAVAAIDVSSLSDDELVALVIRAELLLNAAEALSAVASQELEGRGA